jgi:probable phosphoglycerate mutase
MVLVSVLGCAMSVAASTSALSTRVTLVRHGQTEWNLAGRFQGSLDSPLTERGLAQAHATRARVSSLAPAAVYTSDLLRARRTAEVLHGGLDAAVPVVVDPRLRERNFGIFEGKTSEEMRALHPAEHELMRSGGPEYAMPRAESKADVLARLKPFLQEVAIAHAGQHVVVVSHGGTLNIVLKWVLQLPIDQHCNWEMHNLACSTIIHRHREGWKARTIGDVGHLDAAGLSDS